MQKILKVRFDQLSLEEAKNRILNWAQEKEQRQICTPNPEILLEAERNHKFQKLLNHSALNIADGIGILWAAKYLKISSNTNSKIIKIWRWTYSILAIIFRPSYIRSEISERVTGSDLMREIIKGSSRKKIKIFLLGAMEGVAEKVKTLVTKEYADIEICGTYSGTDKREDEKKIIEKIKRSEAQVLFVAFGAPKQELWINRNLNKMPNVKVAIGVGGSFDFIAKTKLRAPKWMQKLGIEWLYRLIQEPRRIKRIYNATIKFPILILRKSLKS